MHKIDSTKDLIMALLYAKGPEIEHQPIHGKTRLMKMIFLFEKEMRKQFNKQEGGDAALTEFEAYDFGPYSSKVYDDLEFLVNNGFIKAKAENSQVDVTDDEIEAEESEHHENENWIGMRGEDENQNILNVFSLTSLGKEFVKSRIPLSQTQWEYLTRFKAKCIKTPLQVLLKYVYTKYPKMAENSKIKDRYVY